MDRDLQAAKRYEEICRVSTEVFSEVGYHAGTTEAIARRVGLTQPALYHYVGAKHTLLVLICESVGARLMEGLNAALASEAPAHERLRTLLSDHLLAIQENVPAFKVYLTEARHLPAPDLALVRRQEGEYVGAIVELVREAQAQGDLRSVIEPWVLARLLMGAANWVHMWYRGQMPLERLVDDLLGMASLGDSLTCSSDLTT